METVAINVIRNFGEKSSIVTESLETKIDVSKRLKLSDVTADRSLQCQVLTANTPQKICDLINKFDIHELFELSEIINMQYVEPKCSINGDNTMFCTVSLYQKIKCLTDFVIRVYTFKIPKHEALEAELNMQLQGDVIKINIPYSVQKINTANIYYSKYHAYPKC